MAEFKKYKAFISDNSDSILADKIKNVYLGILDSMTMIKQQHFLSRLSKSYGNKWKSKIRELGKELSTGVVDIFTSYKNGEIEGSVDAFIKMRNANNANVESKKKGNQWVFDNREEVEVFLSYLEVLMKFNIVCRLKCEDYFDPKDLAEIRKWLIENWESKIDWVIENSEVFTLIPVQSINIFYYMSSLKLTDPNIVSQREIQFLESLRNEYEGKLEDDVMFNNYLYALTHIIIGESWFYEYKLPLYKEKYDWIIDFLKKNKERIFEAVPDIVIEIGVVMLICNEISEAKIYKKYTRNKIGKSNYIEPLDVTKGPEESEHTNILAIMLLKGF